MNIYIYSKIYAYSQHMSTLCRLANPECLSGLINGGRHHDHHEIDSESFFFGEILVAMIVCHQQLSSW